MGASSKRIDRTFKGDISNLKQGRDNSMEETVVKELENEEQKSGPPPDATPLPGIKRDSEDDSDRDTYNDAPLGPGAINRDGDTSTRGEASPVDGKNSLSALLIDNRGRNLRGN